MFDWLRDNAAVVSALGSLATVVIWLLYLQLFYRNFRLQQEPHLIIKQGHGFDLDTPCYVSNMSQHPVDVMAVLIDAHHHGEHVTVGAPQTSGGAPEPKRIDQPLAAGSYLQLDTFRALLQRVVERVPRGDPSSAGGEIILEVRIVALVGAQQVPRGARRRFEISYGGDREQVRPVDVLPEQLSSRRQRRLAREWLEQAQLPDR